MASWTTIRWWSPTSSAKAASSPAAQRWISAASPLRNLRPPDGAALLHRGHSNQFRPRLSPKFLRNGRKDAAIRAADARICGVRRALIVMALLAAVAVSGAVVYQSAARERDYRTAPGRAATRRSPTARPSAAIENYSGAIALRPDSMLAQLRRGETYRQRGDLDAAAHDFRTAAALDPSATRPLDEWGDILYEQQRYTRAAEVYGARLRLDDRSAATRYRTALAQYRAGDLDAAANSLDLTLKLDDQLADAHYLMGLCLRDSGRPQEAVAAFQQAIARSPGLVAAREELANLYGEPDAGTSELEQLQVLAGLDRRACRTAHRRRPRARAGGARRPGRAHARQRARPVGRPAARLRRARTRLARHRRGTPDRPDALSKALEALAQALNGRRQPQASARPCTAARCCAIDRPMPPSRCFSRPRSASRSIRRPSLDTPTVAEQQQPPRRGAGRADFLPRPGRRRCAALLLARSGSASCRCGSTIRQRSPCPGCSAPRRRRPTTFASWPRSRTRNFEPATRTARRRLAHGLEIDPANADLHAALRADCVRLASDVSCRLSHEAPRTGSLH